MMNATTQVETVPTVSAVPFSPLTSEELLDRRAELLRAVGDYAEVVLIDLGRDFSAGDLEHIRKLVTETADLWAVYKARTAS